ncbi:MAG: mechanosensitive ion channel family protein [Gammaproteobacteria bacterium]|nr:mechanosensitive ion channel family protein [Gammaproteobacteria bacterium]
MNDLLSDAQTALNTELPNLLIGVLVLFMAGVVNKLLSRGLNKVAERGYIHEQLRITTSFTLRWIIILITIISLMGLFGLSVSSIWAAFSALFVLLGIGFVAVWSVLSNMLCSVLLVIFAPFRMGEEIEIQDPAASIIISGKVVSINLMHTTLIHDNDGQEEIIKVPNNFFFQKYVRRVPNKRTISIKRYMAEQHETAVTEQEQKDSV